MSQTHDIIVSAGPERRQKDRRQRQKYFADWLVATDRPWYLPDLDVYRDYLLNGRGLSPTSVTSHISVIRTTFHELLEKDGIRDLIAQSLPAATDDCDEAISKALTVMKAASQPDAGKVEVDRDTEHDYLTGFQIEALFDAPDLSTRSGCRDITIMGLILCCGLKEDEISRLKDSDIQVFTLDRRPAIYVSPAPGSNERVAPIYDDLLFDEPWLLPALEKMAHWSNLDDGYLFPGYRRNGETQTDTPMGSRSIQYMFRRYDVHDQDGAPVKATALKLRRTYARRLYQLGVGIQTIKQNLGHKQQATTKDYIGPPATMQEKVNLHPYRATRMGERFVRNDMDWFDEAWQAMDPDKRGWHNSE